MREEERTKLEQLKRRMGSGQTESAAGAIDPVDALLNDLRTVVAASRVNLTSSLLNNVGDVLERDGFGASRAFLLDRVDRDPQARFLLDDVLPRLQSCPPVVARRALGRYVIKILPALRRRPAK
jgi:hypothetical protein